jgi:hypothetical protein
MLDELRPVDILICNGDAIAGKRERTELITGDRNLQCEMAAEAIKAVAARAVVMSYGTGWHTGKQDDWEVTVSKLVQAREISSHGWLDVNGLIFDYKHKVGGSSIPHGRGTALAKEHLWSVLWAEHGEQPSANVIIRSHVHYFHYCGGKDWLAITTPALQGLGSKFGARVCSNTVDFGLVYFDVNEDGGYSWGWKTIVAETQTSRPIKL